jgi:prephenate dehydrogenase
MSHDPPAPLARVAILGLGLMGGSLGLALKRAWPESVIAGYDATAGVAEQARARGAIDQPCAGVTEALRAADAVIVAAPTLAARELLDAIGAGWGALADGAIVTDVCSVKAPVIAWARAALPELQRFVGGHPMCGSERAGIAAADADLYIDARWVVTPTPETEPDALARAEALARAVGARPRLMDAVAHDDAVAAVSHLPLAVAAALAGALAEEPDWPAAAKLAAGGYRDTTRVAAGDPIMGRDMLLANRARILARLDAFNARLERLRAALASGDAAAVEALLRAASAARRDWADGMAQDDDSGAGVQ